MGVLRMDEFLRAIHDAVVDAVAKGLAEKIGCSHVALLQRANPNDDAHRMNVEQLVQVIKHSGDIGPLEALAALFGYDLKPKEEPAAQSILAAFMAHASESADATSAVHSALADGRVSSLEAKQILKELKEAKVALEALELSVVAG